MTEFSKKPHLKKPISSLDGFISNTGNLDKNNIRRRFRQNYSPNHHTVSNDLENFSGSSDGFYQNNSTQELGGSEPELQNISHTPSRGNSFDLNFE